MDMAVSRSRWSVWRSAALPVVDRATVSASLRLIDRGLKSWHQSFKAAAPAGVTLQ